MQDEAIKAGLFFFPKQRTHSAWGCWRLPVAATTAFKKSKTAAVWEICPVVQLLYLGCQQSSPSSQKSILRCCIFPLTCVFAAEGPTHKCWLGHFLLLGKATGIGGIVCGVLYPSALTANGIACPILPGFEISLPPLHIPSLLCHPDWSVTFMSNSH